MTGKGVGWMDTAWRSKSFSLRNTIISKQEPRRGAAATGEPALPARQALPTGGVPSTPDGEPGLGAELRLVRGTQGGACSVKGRLASWRPGMSWALGAKTRRQGGA